MILKSALCILILSLQLFAQQAWLDPDYFPDAMKCATEGTNLITRYTQGYRGIPSPLYRIRTTPVEVSAGNQTTYRSPVIDGTLENDIWAYAETLLVNSWEDAGRPAACGEKKTFNGPLDLHAIWRFCYNHDGLYVSCEVHDDVYDVDSLGGWFSQDAVEIGIDPWDWGDYSAGKWNDGEFPANNFRRYWSNNAQIMTKTDDSHLNYIHLIARGIPEPYIAGLVKGIHRNNYGRGDEATNFIRGDGYLHGIDFAAKYQGVDSWGRAIVHYEFKFPFHGSLWSTLSKPGSGYFNASTELINGKMLPQVGTKFKFDMKNGDDDIPGNNGSAGGRNQMGRMRGAIGGGFQDGFAQEVTVHDHWSDTKYYMVLEYAGSAQTLVAPVVTGSSDHGYLSIAKSWVVVGNETERYDFTMPGTVRFNDVAYYYDSTGISGGRVTGTITSVRTGSQAGTFSFKKNSSNDFLDSLTVVLGSTTYYLIPAFNTGYSELVGRWVKASLESTTVCLATGTRNYALSPISGASGGVEFRFVALSAYPSDSPYVATRYRNCADSVYIYRTGTDEILDVMTYLGKPQMLAYDRVRPFASYEFAKIVDPNDINAPVSLIITYINGTKDTLVKIRKLNLMRFGETFLSYPPGGNVTTPDSLVNNSLRLFPVDSCGNVAWRIIVEKYGDKISVWDLARGACNVTRGIVPVTGAYYESLKLYPAAWDGPVLPGAVLSTDLRDSTVRLGSKIYDCHLITDTTILEGYNPENGTATGRRAKSPTELTPDSAWIEQSVTFVLAKGALVDTFKMLDTSRAIHWLYSNGRPVASSLIFNTIDTSSKNLCPQISNESALSQIETFEVAVSPNPFNPATIINMSIPASMAGKDFALRMYNVRGQLIRTLVKGSVGRNGFQRRVLWEGDNNIGDKVSAGIYYYQLNVGSRVLRGSIALIK